MKLAIIILTLTLALGANSFADDHKEMEGKGMKGMDMTGMDMNKMHEMMKECMKKQEDDKMCHQEIMDKCTAKMSMDKCQSLMNDMKKHKIKK